MQVENNTEMIIHHHQPSMAFVRARQIRGYTIHLDLQVIAEESKLKKEEK